VDESVDHGGGDHVGAEHFVTGSSGDDKSGATMTSAQATGQYRHESREDEDD
jgi:hypothetical protein